jgi:L-asparaginase/Glu-tRNA(Gln) amidotransferase subunit D
MLLAVVSRVPAVHTQALKPTVVILATGGTIAGAAATGTQAGYTSGAVTIDAMIAAVPGIRDLANLKGEQISNVGSQDMSFDILLKLAKRINELAKLNDVDGIVITHGTEVQTFMSPLRGLVGIVNYGKMDYFTSPEWKHTTQSAFDISRVTQMPRVDIIFASMDMSPDSSTAPCRMVQKAS